MQVRRAELSDLLWLRMLFFDLLTEHGMSYPQYGASDLETFTTILAARLGRGDPGLVCWVAEEGHTVGGFLQGDILERPIGNPRRFAVCHWLFVVPAWRGQGVGRALSHAAILEGKEKGVLVAEIAATTGDGQWAERGWVPVATTFALPIDAALASLAPTVLPNGGDDATTHGLP